ncbi:MAG: circadian clock protein KaiC [Sphingomonas sp.]|nr:MAG: circadian clock protein KaiC [Sphingomonas sp.]
MVRRGARTGLEKCRVRQEPSSPSDGSVVSTGLDPLNYILDGGYAYNRVHLIEGEPGSGKTTLGLQFLLAGRDAGERCLYITLSESRDELLHVAKTHGWDMTGVDIFELVPPELSLDVDREQSIVYSSDLELGETVNMVMEAVSKVEPTRIVFDSLSEIRLLAQGPLRFRRQLLALKHYFAQRGCTALFLDDLTQTEDDLSLHSLAHGVVRLEQIALPYGSERRRLRVYKMRARAFRAGSRSHGGGGLDYGTTTLIIGPSGSGKTTLSLQYVFAALERGEKALFVSFDETERVFMRRAAGMDLDLSDHVAAGRLCFRQVDPGELSPGELTGIIRDQVERVGATVVVLDSLSGYQLAMPEEQHMLLQMHEVVTYLNQQGVLGLLVLTQTGMIGTMQSPVDLTYLADSVMLLRFFEADGAIRRVMSFLKRRMGPHEGTLREFRIDSGGIRVGPQLTGFRGVLTGTPEYGGSAALLTNRDES